MGLLAALAPALTSLIPHFASGVGRLIDKVTGGAKPANVDEEVKLMNATTQKLQALAQLDSPGDCHKWVNDIRALMRPVLSLLILVGFFIALFSHVDNTLVRYVYMLVEGVVFYMFGERTLLRMKDPK